MEAAEYLLHDHMTICVIIDDRPSLDLGLLKYYVMQNNVTHRLDISIIQIYTSRISLVIPVREYARREYT